MARSTGLCGLTPLAGYACLLLVSVVHLLSSSAHEVRERSSAKTKEARNSPHHRVDHLTTAKFDRRAFYPWTDDPQCKHFSIQLSKPFSLPKWALTSFPGSGVTWTRQIIEGVTGIYTASAYRVDPTPFLEGNKSRKGVDNPHCGCTIIDKDHEATMTTIGLQDYFRLLYWEGYVDQAETDYGGQGVLLLRNPMDVVFTYRNWQLEGKVGHAKPEAFQGKDWDDVVDFVAYAWADHAVRWIEQIEHGTVIFYETLRSHNATEEIERMLSAMKLGPINKERLQCALKHRDRKDHKRVNKTWQVNTLHSWLLDRIDNHTSTVMIALHLYRRPLTKEQQSKMLKAMHKVQTSLRRKKWPSLPIHLYDFHGVDMKTSHEYPLQRSTYNA